MKFRITIFISAIFMLWSGLVRAQSSVTLYGIISAGVAYVNNQSGAHSIDMISSTMQANRMGFRIVEDLGGGLRVIATLENGFSATNGTLGQGGRLFGRQAFVGLSSERFGTLTLGRQPDMLWDYLNRYVAAAAANSLAAHVGDNDNTFGTFHFNNSIKYATPNWKGLSAEALYAFSNSPGALANNNAVSLGAGYSHGQLTLGAAYLELHRPGNANPDGAVTNDYGAAPFTPFGVSPLHQTGVDTQRVAGGQASYNFGSTQLNALITDSRFSYLDGSSMHFDNYDVNATYYVNPAVILGVGYVFTKASYGGVASLASSPKWHMAALSVDYFLSKRTDVYVYGVAQRALGGAKADIFGVSPSSTGRQMLALAGIRHKF